MLILGFPCGSPPLSTCLPSLPATSRLIFRHLVFCYSALRLKLSGLVYPCTCPARPGKGADLFPATAKASSGKGVCIALVQQIQHRALAGIEDRRDCCLEDMVAWLVLGLAFQHCELARCGAGEQVRKT